MNDCTGARLTGCGGAPTPMQKYIGTKIVFAEPATKGKCYKGPEMMSSEQAAEPGYKVVYPDGYESWSPKAAFEQAYRPTDGMTFGLALEAMKVGKKCARPGWNGKGMYLQAQFPDEHSKMTFPYLYMTIPDCTEGLRRLPWQPAQVDLFSDDWMIIY
ncbi:MAG: DUF2829 domain-containing protein [Clostridiaceae bacterium]